MIISHKYKFIFVHARKVAGSSVKVSLAPFLGPKDIIIGSWNEILESGVNLNFSARRVLGRPKPQLYYLASRINGKSHAEAVNIGIKAYYRGRLSANPPHPTAAEIKRYFPDEWLSYFKFSFARNPWERVASDYFWRARTLKKKFSFQDYLCALKMGDRRTGLVHPGGASNWEMISDETGMAMNFVGRYERLHDDFAVACSSIGIPTKELAVRAKGNPSRLEYGALFGREERALIAQMFAEEIAAFGFEYPY